MPMLGTVIAPVTGFRRLSRGWRFNGEHSLATSRLNYSYFALIANTLSARARGFGRRTIDICTLLCLRLENR